MPKYYCKYCGLGSDNTFVLSNSTCPVRHGGKHEIYYGKHDSGPQNAPYICRHCGRQFSSLRMLLNNVCPCRQFNQKHEAL